MPKKKRQSVAEKRLKAYERQRRRRANMTPIEKEIVAEDHKQYMRRLRQEQENSSKNTRAVTELGSVKRKLWPKSKRKILWLMVTRERSAC